MLEEAKTIYTSLYVRVCGVRGCTGIRILQAGERPATPSPAPACLCSLARGLGGGEAELKARESALEAQF